MNDEKLINDEWGMYGKCIVPSRFYQVYGKGRCLKNLSNETPIINNPEGELSDHTADYELSGEIEQPLNVTGKSITLNNISVSGGSVLNLSSTGNISSNGMKISGEYLKENGNSAINIKDSEQIIF